VNETVDLLAARALRLRTAARDARKADHAYVIVDGTLIAIDRMARDKPFYFGKHQRHGDVLWVSGGLPGHVHDKKAEWIWGVPDEIEKAGVVVLADSGYQGGAHAHLPYNKRKGGSSWTPRRKPTAPTPACAPR
jgi:hypothetical protein